MKNLLKAINNVRSNVGVVNKNGKNSFHKYNYATANDVLHEVRGACNEEGLIFLPVATTDFVQSKQDQVESFTMHYTVAHADSGESMELSVRCAGEDKGDKKAYKANTGAMKYLFIQLFMLPTDDDPENDKKYPNQEKKVSPQPDKKLEKVWVNPDDENWNNLLKFAKQKNWGIEESLAAIRMKGWSISKDSSAKLKDLLETGEVA